MLGNKSILRVLVFRSMIEDMNEVSFALATKTDVRSSKTMRELELRGWRKLKVSR